MKAFTRSTQSCMNTTFIVFQTLDGCNIVTIPLRVLSLSESAYISLARIAQYHPLPVVQITCIDYFFQQIRNILGLSGSKENVLKEEKDAPWMSQEFIKQKIGCPKILPLTKSPKLPLK